MKRSWWLTCRETNGSAVADDRSCSWLGLWLCSRSGFVIGDKRSGALDLYRETPGPLDGEAMDTARTLADVAAAYLLDAQASEAARDSSDRYRDGALHDASTGLVNGVLLHQRLGHAVARARRSHHNTSILFTGLLAAPAVRPAGDQGCAAMCGSGCAR